MPRVTSRTGSTLGITGLLVLLAATIVASVALARLWAVSNQTSIASDSATGHNSVSPSPELVSSPQVFARDYPLVIEAGVTPQLDSYVIEQKALDRIAISERLAGQKAVEPRILSIDAYRGTSVPDAYGEAAFAYYEIVWIVRAEGTFVPQFGPLGANRRIEVTGWLAFNDAGESIGTGFPLTDHPG